MAHAPEIKPLVNKESQRDKKKAGFLARLFGGGGGSAGYGGYGGMGASGGMGGVAGGGMMATKAGLMALILVGTGVAGGIGMIGYRVFGPGAEMTGNGDNLQLFASKPKEGENAGGKAAAKGGDAGASSSLQYLSQANGSLKESDAAAEAAVKDATASGAAGSSASAGPLNKMGDSGNGVSRMMKNSGKLGALGGFGGTGGGSGAVANSASGVKPLGEPAASKSSSLSGFKKGSGASASGGTSRSVAGRHFGGAAGQAFGVLSNQKGAQSSYAAGQTYDGAAHGGSNIGGNGTPIGGAASVAPGGGGAQPKSTPGPAVNTNNSTSIPTPDAAPMAPWQGQIQKAQMLIAGAAALLLIASLINKPPSPWSLMATKAIGAVVALIGALVIAIGVAISHGPYGQILQGGMLAAAGTGLILAGAMAGFSSQTEAKPAVQASAGPPPVQASAAVPASNSAFSGSGIGGVSPFVLLGGGLALVGLCGTMFMPPKKYPAQDANDPNWPKGGLFGYQQFPSEHAVKKMIA